MTALSHNQLMGIGGHSEDANLDLWWLCQDNAASTAVVDQSSNALDGVLNGGSNTANISVTGPNSYYTKALDLNGTTDAIIRDSPTTTEPMTHIYWFNGDVITGDPDICTIAPASGTTGGYRGRIVTSSAKLRTVSRVGSSETTIDTTTTYTATNWAFGANVWTSSSSRSVLLDAGGKATNTTSASPSITTPKFCVGGYRTDFNLFNGKVCGVSKWSRVLADAEITEAYNGPEVNYSSGASFSAAGAFNVGTWALPSPFASGSNGTPTWEVVACKADGTSLDTSTSSSGTLDLSANSGNTCYLLVRATNTGGYDIGDFATRTSSYGSANDGYYELASVVASGGGVTLQQRSLPRRVLTGVGRGII